MRRRGSRLRKQDYTLIIDQFPANTQITTASELTASFTGANAINFKLTGTLIEARLVHTSPFSTASNSFWTDKGVRTFHELSGQLKIFGSITFRDSGLQELVAKGVTSASGQSLRRIPLTICDLPLLENIPNYTEFTGTAITEFYFPSVLRIDNDAFLGSGNSSRIYNFPKCTQLGDSTTVNNRCFDSVPVGAKIRLNIALQNSTDPDIVDNQNRGVIFEFVN